MANSILSIDDDILTHIRAATADQLAPAAARWKQAWAPVAFAVGALLLSPAAPQWISGVQAIATYELPTADTAWSWLTTLLFDPAAMLNPLLAQVTQTWLYTGGPMDVMATLGAIVLAVASVAGLAQLLGDERRTNPRRVIPEDARASER